MDEAVGQQDSAPDWDIGELYDNEKTAYFAYLDEANGTFLPKHLKRPDPAKVAERRDFWIEQYNILYKHVTRRDVQEHLVHQSKVGTIKRKKK